MRTSHELRRLSLEEWTDEELVHTMLEMTRRSVSRKYRENKTASQNACAAANDMTVARRVGVEIRRRAVPS